MQWAAAVICRELGDQPGREGFSSRDPRPSCPANAPQLLAANQFHFRVARRACFRCQPFPRGKALVGLFSSTHLPIKAGGPENSGSHGRAFVFVERKLGAVAPAVRGPEVRRHKGLSPATLLGDGAGFNPAVGLTGTPTHSHSAILAPLSRNRTDRISHLDPGCPADPGRGPCG